MESKREYNKFKDNRPEDTVNKLQNILHDAGIDATYFWTNNEELECYSNRVTVTGTSIGSNGKGTSRIYALASGYAELTERLQNGAAYIGSVDPEFLKETGMIIAPDERFDKAVDLVRSDNPLMDSFFRINSCESELDKMICIEKWAGGHPIEGKGEDTLLTVPFASLKQRKVIPAPFAIYSKMYGTNGMCAGNTQEEALVQGMAEIFERYTNVCLIKNPITPPTVPDQYLKKYPTLWDRIQKIEKGGRYKVIVKDCSLGKGYPAIGAIIGNVKKGTFGFRMASHYSFPIALERTLTEALQGRDLENFTESCSIGPEPVCIHKENIANIYKCGVGNYRKELFYSEPSYEFAPWEEKSRTNSGMLKHMLDLLLKEGYDVLIRDVSFLGFPSYHILAPGFSEIYPADDYKLKEINTAKKISGSLDTLHGAKKEDVERLRRLLAYKQNSIFETNLSGMLRRPFNRRSPGGDYQDLFLLTVCYYRLGMFEEAGNTIDLLAARALAKQDPDYPYYRNIGLLIQLKNEKTPEKQIREILEKTSDHETAQKIISYWMDPDAAFGKLYPRFRCWDCPNCEANGICDYAKTQEVLRSLRALYRENVPDQNQLFKTL